MNQTLEIFISHLDPIHVLIAMLVIFSGVIGAIVTVALALIHSNTAIDTPIFKLNVKKDDK